MVVGIVGSLGFVDPALEVEFRSALVSVAIVVALCVFVGNAGVISFGHVSFVAVGAFAAGVMTIPVELKPTITPGSSRCSAITPWEMRLARARSGRRWSLRAARRHPAHALVRARGEHRDVRRPRSHLQHPQQLDEDRPGTADVDHGSRDDRPPPGHAGRHRGGHRRLRVPAEPVRAQAACGSRGLRRRPRGRHRRPPGAALGIRAFRALSGFAGGLSSTLPERSRPGMSTSISRSSRWRCSSSAASEASGARSSEPSR